MDLNCCNKPAQTNLAEFKYVINGETGRYESEECWNRICTNCYAHWYGNPDSLKKYTRKEWDDYVNNSFNIELIAKDKLQKTMDLF